MNKRNQIKKIAKALNEATFGVNTQTLADHLKPETINKVAEYLYNTGIRKHSEDVTSKYEGMITAFQADFSLATRYDELDYVDFRHLITKRNPSLMKDIDLLGELEFKIRHKQIIILEDITEETNVTN